MRSAAPAAGSWPEGIGHRPEGAAGAGAAGGDRPEKEEGRRPEGSSGATSPAGAARAARAAGPGEGTDPDRAPVFVTVGTQLPFPRLIDAMDALAPSLGRPVIAQVGPMGAGGAPQGRWRNLEVAPFLGTTAFAALAARAAVIVGHAGIGTFLTARSHGAPAVLMPRRAALGEHRNEHQIATARRLEGRPGLAIAWEAEALGDLVRAALDDGGAPAAPAGSAGAAPLAEGTLDALIARLAQEIARA